MTASSTVLGFLALVRLTWDSIEIGIMSVERGCSEGTMIVRRIAKNFTKGLLEETVKGNPSRLILDIQIGGSCKRSFQAKTVWHFSSTDNDIAVR